VSWTAWDGTTARRTFSFALAALALALLVTAASDEGGVSLAGRFARTLPAAPLLAAAATGLVAQRSRARGEWRALASLGIAPWTIARGAVVGATLFALLCALLTCVLPGAATAFFPRAAFAAHFAPQLGAGGYGFVDPASGWTVLPGGGLLRGASATAADVIASVPPGASLSAAAVLVAAGLGMSLLVAAALAQTTTRSWVSRIGRPVALAALVLIAFQHVAATGHGAVVPVALSLLFVVDGARELRGGATV
jgi:hypothetical protein